MDPIFLNIGGFTIAWYGVLMTLGIVAGISIGLKLARERGLDADLFERMIYTMLLWGFIGARLVFVATSWDLFADTPMPQRLLDIINLRQGGISIHGGLLGGILAAIWFTRKHRMNFYRYLDLAAPGVALGIIGGRLGNIMNGTDTVGRVTGWPIGFPWPHSARAFHDGMCIPNPDPTMDLSQYCQTIAGQQVMTAPVHFTQLYGVLIGVALLIASFFWLKSKKPGWAFWQFWLWYSLLRAGVEETFRLNPLMFNTYLNQGLDAPGIGLWTMTQVFSVPIVLVSLYMLWRLAAQPEPQPVPVAGGQVMTHAEARAQGGE
ncbi:Prolipoprotein diacylglyceryl transferase [Deinococcus proteolyticus MRP]|uniref:Phosphatidylglycerol--prolipoprotein diacylglyceryl transferase n=1 Tax=Deinococcus proteolyticus (strain ATCC 35074 / DSM 20540 / JCM 6276 / NBRC 101906 / NCIMB 13154 / VKM Ac-1939 / CCM 2703 / MRP) TaxID=693977 RepID=F0RKM4_DEIPM|nr:MULTISPECIES: prolipoprotein diacylglyceryl transferase [Deinococcus]ADY25714.1 Prolipoprotein diacylglyceryl transferase [Deinococcus proteolyticus MRP]MCY1701836.1 prolipoprotein diacylglyceryl transferase [Deinococcus sp. SL84]